MPVDFCVRKLSDKTEFGSEAAANHPRAFIFFEQFPEGVIRLAALRYEWRPPENMGEIVRQRGH